MSTQIEPRVVDIVGPTEKISVKPFLLSFLEEVSQPNNMAGGNQTYYATGVKQDIQFDPD